MPRELITVQVGQCGNQIGRRFWEKALAEHAASNSSGCFDECMSSFFRNVDARYRDDDRDIPIGDGTTPISNLRARAVLVDMDDGPVNQTLSGPLGDLFNHRQLVTDVSGAGNNWAHGYAMYGPKYRDELLEVSRQAAEKCESLQSFFLMHSMGGGTGSGLGTYILSMLEDEYPNVYRFSTVVFPSEDDDVITSPYNSLLALKELTDHADCVLPVDNASLIDLVARADSETLPTRQRGGVGAGVGSDDDRRQKERGVGQKQQQRQKEEGFDAMNGLVASLLTDLTASMRFPGELNVDLNEITTNLVPFPRMHYLVSGLSPLPPLASNQGSAARGGRRGSGGDGSGWGGAGAGREMRSVRQMFSDGFAASHQLVQADPKSGRFLACALLLRGNVRVSDINANVARLRGELDLIHWNTEGFKIGMCGTPAVGVPTSLLALSNSCCISDTFRGLRSRFDKLYSRKAMVHHYTHFVEGAVFDEARESLSELISDYEAFATATPRPPDQMPPRLRPAF